MRVTKTFCFETAHRLLGYKGSCANIHGHSYHLEITIDGPVNKETGMLLDFKDLKQLVERRILSLFDHSLILERNDPLVAAIRSAGIEVRIFVMDVRPTAENMLILFYELLAPDLPGLVNLKLYETETSYAELPCG